MGMLAQLRSPESLAGEDPARRDTRGRTTIVDDAIDDAIGDATRREETETRRGETDRTDAENRPRYQ